MGLYDQKIGGIVDKTKAYSRKGIVMGKSRMNDRMDAMEKRQNMLEENIRKFALAWGMWMKKQESQKEGMQITKTGQPNHLQFLNNIVVDKISEDVENHIDTDDLAKRRAQKNEEGDA